MTYAGFWRRLVAYIIDGIVVSVAIGIVYEIFVATGIINFEPMMDMANDLALQSGAEPDPAQAMAAAQGMMQQMSLLYLADFIIAWLYEALLTSSASQATLGKMALGMKVTDANGERVGFGRATGRFFGKLVSGFILYIGFLMVAFTARKQGLHDMMASTLVLRR